MTAGSGLEDVYGATIARIKAQGGDKSRLGIGALMWICYAERPLSPNELCHALGIELGSTDFNAGNIPSITTLVSCCQGLITADKEASKASKASSKASKASKASTVRLIHFTLRDYLSAHPHIFSRPHSAIAEVCLTYLNCQQVRILLVDTLDDLDALIDNEPFLAYCSRYWGVHAKKELSDCAMSLALKLFREYDGHISALVFVQQAREYLDDLDIDFTWNGLHHASYVGSVQIVTALMGMGRHNPNQGDYLGCTALSLACTMGHEEVVKILLRQEGVNPDKPDNEGQTPLSYAARGGHEGVVKMLLQRGEVNPDNPDDHGRTPLWFAAGEGHEGVARILLELEEVSPDQPDNFNKTPLWCAAEGGHEGVVKMLLEREEVNPITIDNSGATPLFWATEWGHEGVELLQEWEEVNHDKIKVRGPITLYSYGASNCWK